MTAWPYRVQSRGLGQRGLAVVLALLVFIVIAARVEPASALAPDARAGAQQDGPAGGPTNAVLGSHRAGSSPRINLANYLDYAESTPPDVAANPAPADQTTVQPTTLASSNPGASGARAPPADRTI
jgi:hypothetical protein